MAEASADTILHPVRMRILMTLTGRHLTTTQIGAALPEVPQATLYRHLSRLVKAEVVTITAQRPVRGVMEKVYALAGGSLSVSPDVSQMSHEDWIRGFAAFTASLLGQFGVYMRQEEADPVADGVSFRTAPLFLSDAEQMQLQRDLHAVIASARSYTPAPGRHRRLLSTILVPDADIPGADLLETGEL